MGTNTTMTATLKIIADVTSAQSSVNKLAQAFSKVKLSDSLKTEMKSAFSSFDKLVEEFKAKLQEPVETKGQASSLTKSATEIKKQYDTIIKQVKSAEKELSASGVDLTKVFKIDDTIQQQIKKLDEQIKTLKQNFTDLGQGKTFANATTSDFEAMKAKVGEAAAKVVTLEQAFDSLGKKEQTVGKAKFTINTDDAKNNLKTIEELLNSISTNSNKKTRNEIIEALTGGDLETAVTKLEELRSNYERFSNSQGENSTWQANVTKVQAALEVVRSLYDAVTQSASNLENQKMEATRAGVEAVAEGLNNAKASAEAARPAVQNLSTSTREMAQSQLEYNSSLDQMKSRISYFFSINNAVQLLQRTLRSAFNTVKELDAAMTETAVVTDFTVGDMWNQLPTYTQAANELGTTTLGAYETMTLFYQQGLDTNEVFEIGTETMKMARIAGLDYADATDKMTAALRGFNMELNDTSAQRVNDVYSELAAITAADTEEIATAMTKTASIASSANMEFETTSAFLSQIIETTRESAETAGTAMKTIVARFQELKKDPSEIEEVDGEVVDANKIETALRSVGVALRDTEGQFRDLDDVFLDLASIWDTLDVNTQRYVATMAAGSRQQSRFIAMMQDYDRTLELVDAAYNSSGSSQRQFEKTVDSLESKLNNLKNAWDEFAMGLANSSLIKGAVDALTKLLELLNKLTTSGNGFASMLLKIGAAWGTFKIGKTLLASLIEGFGSLKTGTGILEGFFSGLKKEGTKQFGGLATILKRTFSSNVIKWSDFIQEDNVFANLPNKIANLKTQITSITDELNQDLTGVAWAQDTDAVAFANAALKEEQIKLNAELAASEGELALQQSLRKAQEDGLLSTQQMAVLLSSEELRTKAAEIISSETLDAAQKKEQLSQLALNSGKQTGIGFGLKSALTKLGESKASLVKAAAIKSENAAMLAGIATMGIYIAIAAALVIGVVAIANAIETEAEKRKRLNETIEQNQAAYEELESEVSEVKSSMEELGTLETELDDLAVGTDEWRAKLVEVNQEVLSLIEKFPRLAAAFEIGEHGQLGFNSEALEEYYSDIGNLQSDIQSSSLLASYELQKISTDSLYSDFVGQITDSLGPNLADMYANDLWKMYQNAVSALNISNGDIGAALEAANKSSIRVGFEEDSGTPIYSTFEKWLTNQGISDTFENTVASFFTNSSQKYKETSGSLEAYIASVLDQDTLLSDYSDAIVSLTANRRSADTQALYKATDFKIGHGNMSDHGTIFENALDRLEDYVIQEFELTGEDLETIYGSTTTRSGKKNLLRQFIANKENESGINEYGEEVSEYFNWLSQQDKETADNLAAFITGNAEGLSAGFVSQLMDVANSGQKLDLDNITQYFGLDAEAMAEKFGMNVEQLATTFGSVISQAVANQRKVYSNITKRVVKNTGSSEEALAKAYQENFQKFDEISAKYVDFFDFSTLIGNIEQSLANSGNDQLTNIGVNQFWDAAESGKYRADDLADFESYIASIDWSNPIEGAEALGDAINSDNTLIQEFAQSTSEIGEQIYSASAQMQYFIKSSDFEGVQEELEDILDTQDEISAQDVKKLAGSYKSLDKMLDNGVATAEGLAKALTLIQKGSISFTDLTNNVMTAIGSMSSLEQMSAETLETLSNFDPGIDENEVGDFIGTAYETISENLSNGAVGNSQNFEYLDFLFPGWSDGLNLEAFNGDWNKLEDETYKRMKFYEGILKQNSEDLGMSWAGLADGLQLNGKAVEVDENGENALDRANLAVTRLSDGGVALTAADGGAITATTEEVVAALAEAYGVSEQYAQMMLTDFSNYSAGLALELQGNDYAEGIKKVVEDLNDGDGFLQIDQRDLDTIAKLYGKTAEEIYADLQSYSENPIHVTDWFDTETGALKSGSTFTEELVDYYTNTEDIESALTDKQAELKAAQAELAQAVKHGTDEEIAAAGEKIKALQAEADAIIRSAYENLATFNYDEDEGTLTSIGVNYADLIQEGMAQGMSETEAAQWADQAIAAMQTEFEGTKIVVTYTMEDGTTQEHTLEEGQTGQQGYISAQTTHETTEQAEAMAEALKTYFSDIPISFTAEEDAITLYGEYSEQMGQASLENPIKLAYELTPNGETPESTEDSTTTTSVATQEITIKSKPESLEALVEAIRSQIDSNGPYTTTVSMGEDSPLQGDILTITDAGYEISTYTDAASLWSMLQAYMTANPLTLYTTTVDTSGGAHHAKGIHDSSTSHTALIGEAGPEIHQTSNGWYLAETPQLAQIEKGDTVYNASETKDILNGGTKTKVRPRYASAYRSKWGYSGRASSSYASTGSTSGTTSATSAVADAEEAAEIWENTFDWLYNLTEDINELLRDREKLERQYDKILSARNTTAKELWDNVQDQLAVLETQRQREQEMYDKRVWEMKDYISKNSDLQDYAWYNWDDMTIEIDWDKIDAVTDEDMGEAIEDYVSKLEDIQDEMDDAEDELMDIEDRIQELIDQGKDEYLDFENMVFEALQEQKQALIDNASEISEAIADTNSALLDSLSDAVSQMRDDRELENDRTDLEDQQKKLIYLQQDTSGGNALEILKLQQEIEDAQQSYTDKLIDRKIDELQQQNDEASEQRERQIELAQEQLDQWSTSQEKWNEIHALMGDGINSVGQIIDGSELMKVIQDKEGVESLSSYGQMDWLKTLESDVKAGLTWFAQDQQLEKIGKTSGTITFTDSSGTEHTGTVNSDGSVTVRDDKNGGNWTYSQVFKNFDGTYRTFEENASFKKDPEPVAPTTTTTTVSSGQDITNSVIKGVAAAILNGGYNWSVNPTRKARLTEVFGSGAAYDIQAYLNRNYKSLTANDAKGYGYNTMKAQKWNKYKTGGIADYTGPAWLDGTPSKPEIVLNAQDTKNFIELKNVLASLFTDLHGAGSSTDSMSNGDNYYDIDINVESMSSDYDVEQVADKIRGLIVQDGMYRNVNSVNRLK